MSKRFNLVNQRYGRLIVFEYSHKHKSPCGRIVNYWKCKCDCGNITSVSIGDLRKKKNSTTSCGCYGKEKQKEAMHNLRREKSYNWLGYGDMPGTYFCLLKSNAKSKNRKFELSKEYLWNLFLQQNKKCILSGLDLCFNSKQSKYDGNASLDRIDSSEGYIEGNVQWVHKDINYMKQEYSVDYLIEMCRKVVLQNEKR